MRGLAKTRRDGGTAIWLAYGWLFLLAATWCLQAAAAPRSLRFERLGMEQGLSQESVMNVLQDRTGFIWIGTQAGLNRFDGYKVKVFRNDPLDRTRGAHAERHRCTGDRVDGPALLRVDGVRMP